MGRRAFTLVELTLVIALLGVMALSVTTATDDPSNISLDAVARKAASDLRYAQQLAQTTGRPHGVRFTASNGYTVYDQRPDRPVIDPLTQRTMVEDLATYAGVTIGNTIQFEFDTKGRPVLGGGSSVLFRADSGSTRRLYVTRETGAVTEERVYQRSGCSCTFCEARGKYDQETMWFYTD